MSTWDLTSWSQQQLTILLAATFAGIILVLIALIVYLHKTRVPPAAATPDKSEGGVDLGDPPDILLRRKGWTNRLEIEIGGKPYRRMRDVEDPTARRAAFLAAADLVAFAGIATPQSISEPGRLGDEAAPKAPQAASDSEADAHYAPARELAIQAFLAQLEQANLGVEEPKNWLDIVGKSLARRSLADYESRNFVEEIEALLQRRLEKQGAGLEVHLRTDGQGIVRVEVDGILYDSPGDIPHLAVREALRAAVGEWEARY